ncbi:MAG: GHKL domain-containing protein [Firmicutes bacterium]|nr:GHKL domain-containing protein [Bacillota bacterium]
MIEKWISTVVNIFAAIVVLHNVSKRKINLKDENIYFSFIIMMIVAFINMIYFDTSIRLIISTFIIFLGNYIIFRDNINKNLVSTFMNQFIVALSELTCAAILFIIINPVLGVEFINTFTGSIITNIIISVLMIVISSLTIMKKIYEKLLELTHRIKPYVLLVFIICLIVPINILVFMVYIGNSLINILFLIILFLSIYTIIIYFALSEKNQNIKFKRENEVLLDTLNDYEKMLDYQRVNNHENKNQLLVIRSMISKNNKKALEYLDEIITEKRKDDEGLYTYAKIIPEGGLQGLVYQKMLKMKENNITVNLNVDKKIRKVNFDNLSSKTNYDLCRIVGVILDNAIEEVVKLKEKEIVISMYKDEISFVIEVSNKCKTIPDLSKLDEKGYTTKTKGHGYGLSLLKEIIENNKQFINERSLNKDIFTQIIKIKM